MPALLSADIDPKIIYSIGTSTRTWEKWITTLKAFAIETLVDVRRFPGSRRYPHFNQENFMAGAEKEGIKYFYLGKELGGFKRPDYTTYMSSEAFHQGINLLEGIAGEYLTAFFCCEVLPWRCHRRFIARELSQRGWQVIHILDEKRIWKPAVKNNK